jgi:hypothetical protein
MSVNQSGRFIEIDRTMPESGKSFFLSRQLLNAAALCGSDSLVLLTGLFLGNWIIYLIHGIPVSIHYALAVIPAWCIGAVITRAAPAWGLGAVEELRRTQLLLLAVFPAVLFICFLMCSVPSAFLSSASRSKRPCWPPGSGAAQRCCTAMSGRFPP